MIPLQCSLIGRGGLRGPSKLLLGLHHWTATKNGSRPRRLDPNIACAMKAVDIKELCPENLETQARLKSDSEPRRIFVNWTHICSAHHP